MESLETNERVEGNSNGSPSEFLKRWAALILSLALFAAILAIVTSETGANCLTLSQQIRFLQVFAKCPGLGNLTNSNGQYGTDYLDIAIDIGLAMIASLFIFLSVRDILRKRNDENNSDSESEDL